MERGLKLPLSLIIFVKVMLYSEKIEINLKSKGFAETLDKSLLQGIFTECLPAARQWDIFGDAD